MRTTFADRTELVARVRLARYGSCVSVGADGTTGFDPWFPLSGLDDLGVAAKRVCALCPVKDDCLDVALTYGEDYGIWGGLTAAERRDLTAAPEHPADTAAGQALPLATAA
ncbi:hypothetical protein GCM10027447_01860 [Glycomyces halotolerans]